MFRRFYLLCLILSSRCVIGRLPVDVSPVNTFEDYEDRVITKFAGVHAIVSVNRSLYVLSKNQVSSLSVNTEDGKAEHRVSQVIAWPSTTLADSLCLSLSGGDHDACHNYIRIFVPKDESGKSFIVCGTHSRDPQCRIYSKAGNTLEKDGKNGEFSGKSICPYDPKQTGESLYTGGDVYAATVEGFFGQKPVVYRHSITSRHKNIDVEKRDKTRLIDAWFVKLVDSEEKVYVLFKETAVEDNSGLTYSRVGQICKSDNGGEQVLLRQFTSYAKARLNCSFPGQPPFYFDELAAATDFYELPGHPGTKFLMAVMNTPKNSIWGSAVCAFVQRDIESTFRKPYMEEQVGQDEVTYWTEKQSESTVTEALTRCQFDRNGKSVLSAENLKFVRDHPLKSHAVPAWSKDGRGVPLFVKLDARYQFTAISVDPIAGSNRQFFVVILGTSDGKILKIIPPVAGSAKEAHFISETEVYDAATCGEGVKHVRDIKIDKETGFVTVAFSSCVISIPLCPVTSACERACIAAQDPYCAWDGTKCSTVLRPQGLVQDVLHGDVTGLPQCEVASDTGSKVGEGNADGGGNSASAGKATISAPANTTAAMVVGIVDSTTAAIEVARASSLSSGFIGPAAIGAAVGVVLCLLILLVYCACRRSSLASSAEKLSSGAGTPAGERDSLYDERRKSSSYSQRQDRPASNHTQRQHSKRSNSSVEEDESFLENGSEGTANSMEKARRKREKSSKRKSNASSYHRENSVEKPGRPVSVNRQASRESNPESKQQDPGVVNGHEMFAAAGQQQPPSPQNPGFHRTFSASHSRPEAGTRNRQGRKLARQLSLQMPINANSTRVPTFQHHHHSLTPMRFGTQNPLELHAQQQQFVQQQQQQGPPLGVLDAAPPQVWHSSPANNPLGMPRQYQTTSLDRKMRKAGGVLAHAVPHVGQQQPRSYADTLPPPAMDDPTGRRRYPSESAIISNRPPNLLYVSKTPQYHSIEEETSPVRGQYSPTKMPPSMPPMTTGRTRPNQLSLGGSTEQPPQYVISYTNPGTPMTEQIPRFVQSPMSNAGVPLPGQLRKQFSEAAVRSPYVAPQRPNALPHPQSAPTVNPYPPGEKLFKSNPNTPEWDGNHNSFFPELEQPAEVRSRNPSGKAATPTSSTKGFPGYVRPDVVPMGTARAQPKMTHRNAGEAQESTA